MCYKVGMLFGIINSKKENALTMLLLTSSRKDGKMSTITLFLMILCLLFPSFAQEAQESGQNESDSTAVERGQEEEEYTNEDEYYEDEEENNYVTEDDFVVEDKMYRWYITPSGNRVLRCRKIYVDVVWGVHFGPWYAAVDFWCTDYHDAWFTYCPYCRLYYCNHPCHGIHHCHHFNFHSYHHVYHVHNYWHHHRPWKPWWHWKHACHWTHGPHGWHWMHGKHCWHWHHGKNGVKIYHTKKWKHHGHYIKKHPYVKKQVNYGRKPVKVVNKTTLPKPVQKGQYINKKKVITKSDYIKQVKKPAQAKQVKTYNQVKKVNKAHPATQVKKYNQVNNKKTYTKKEVNNYSTNNNKGKVNNQYSKTKPAKKSYTVQNNNKAASYNYKPVKPAQKNNSYSTQKYSSSSKPVSGNTVKRAARNTRQTHGRKR